MNQFEHRGVVEGYYGPPYSHRERVALVSRIGAWGMNRYVHAPKDDPLHRERWREPYPDAQLSEFRELVEAGERAGVEVGFALSPGLSMTYSSPADQAALREKVQGFRDVGARFLGLCVDDVPTELAHDEDRRRFGDLASAHVATAHHLLEFLESEDTLWLVPTDYLGADETPYLRSLGRDLDAAIEVGWTGRTVVSPEILTEEARRRAETLGRRLLLWDNLPVSDGPMRNQLHLGPYRGRDAGLTESLSGALLNPMEHARASGMTLCCAAQYLRDPAAYEADAAWRDAAAELGAGAPRAFALFAAAHRFGADDMGDRDLALEALFDALRQRPDAAAASALHAAAVERVGAAEEIRSRLADRALAEELSPWLESHERESRRIEAAAGSFARFLGTDAGDRGITALDRALAFFGMQGRLTRLPVGEKTSYGPRRALYPQLVSMQNDDARLGRDPALIRDRCLADEILRYVEERMLEEISEPLNRG